MLAATFLGCFTLLVKAVCDNLFSRRYVHRPRAPIDPVSVRKKKTNGREKGTNLAAPNGLGRFTGLLWTILGEASGDGVVEVFPERGRSSNFRRASWGVGGVDDDAMASSEWLFEMAGL